ncbi:MAG: hypothetical protein IJ192_13800 [Clostridia bacterium]|nr:hypothetical protein [Clostridia bacterium]
MNPVTNFVIEMIKDFLNQECNLCRKSEFISYSYMRWAAMELLTELCIYEDIPPLIVLENFRDKMNEYAKLNVKTTFIFSVGSKTAEYFINLLI